MSQTNTQGITCHFRVLLLAAALVALAALFAHAVPPASAQQSSANLTLSAASSTVAETAGSATVTVTLDQPAGEGGAAVTLLPNPADAGTAALGRDYSLQDARATIAEGDTEASISVTIKDDAVNEPDETIILTATCECNVATVSANVVTLTIQDNEQDVGDDLERTHSYWDKINPKDFRVEPAGSALVVKFHEYPGVSAWLRWREDSNPKWTTVKGVRSGHVLDGLANGVLHHVETISVYGTLRSNWASTTGTPSPQGDPPSNPSEMTLSVLGGADSLGEDVGIVTVLARVYGTAPEGGVTVTLDSLDGSPATAVEGRDYNLPGSFTIAEGRTEASVNIAIINDAVNEPDETIYLSATTDAASITTVTGLVLTIRDDEPDLSPQGFIQMEKPSYLTLTPGNGYIDVDFGAAPYVYEYWLQWRADDNPQWTTVRGGRITEINIYSKRHTDDWNIYGLVNGVVHHVRVANVENPYAGFQQWSGWVEASATPIDNLTLSAASPTVAETAGSVTVTATLDQPAPTGGVEVTLTPKSGDAGTAALGRDYTLPETFTIAAGDTTAETEVFINDDAVNERAETINLTASLSNAAGATVTGVTITIQDNEESRSPPGSGSFSGYEPENVKAVSGHQALTITFDRAVLSSLSFWLQWRADDNPEWTTVTPVTSPHTLGNLVNGVLYHIRVTGDDGQHRGGWVSTSGTPRAGGL